MPRFRAPWPDTRRLRSFALALLPLTALAAPALAQDCPNLNGSGQAIRYNGQALQSAQSHSVTAGGNLDLASCAFVQGHGHIARRPDFTLDFTRNQPGYDLEIRADGQCDTVLLVRSPNGQTHYNDDSNGADPAIRLTRAETGSYNIWVGTFGANTCPANLILQTSGGGLRPVVPPQVPPIAPPVAPVPPPQIPPLVPPVAPPVSPPTLPPQVVNCPNPAANGQMLTYAAIQLRNGESRGVTAGGGVSLDACAGVPGHGRVARNPDFTLNLTQAIPGTRLTLGVDGQCDAVLLVRGPDGQYRFNDDTNGLDPEISYGGAQAGEYAIWVGTFGNNTCPATLSLQTSGGGIVPPIVPVPPQPQPPIVALCPNPNANGQMLTYATAGLLGGQQAGVTAGGNLDLQACQGVPGHGHIVQNPDFTLNLTHNQPGATLQLGVDGQCDTVLLVRGPDGQWRFNDDTNGLDPQVQIVQAQPGEYDIWVGTFGASTCPATLALRSLLVNAPVPQPQPHPQPQPVVCPDPGANGQMRSFTAADLLNGQSTGVTAGGPVDLAACPSVPGHGHVIQQPDFTMTLMNNPQAWDMDFAVNGTCDPVLLVHGPDGQWHYNDDFDGLNSRLRVAGALPGEYDIWVGTFGTTNCQATLTATTYTPAPVPPQPLPPQPIPPQPVPPVPAPAKAGTCPDPQLDGAAMSYTAEALWSAQTRPVVAGGNLDAAQCDDVEGYGHLVQRPDFTLTLSDNPQDHALEFRVDGDCDPVLLVYGPNGAWAFNDDAEGLNPRLRIENAPRGAYDIWVGTYGTDTCHATLAAETFPSIAPNPQLPGGVLPDPGNMTVYRGQNGQQFRFQVTGTTSGSIWGTDVYTDDSSVARAAVHAGVLRAGETGVVTVIVQPGLDQYAGSARNGVTSASYGRWSGSYRFVSPAGGK